MDVNELTYVVNSAIFEVNRGLGITAGEEVRRNSRLGNVQ